MKNINLLLWFPFFPFSFILTFFLNKKYLSFIFRKIFIKIWIWTILLFRIMEKISSIESSYLVSKAVNNLQNIFFFFIIILLSFFFLFCIKTRQYLTYFIKEKYWKSFGKILYGLVLLIPRNDPCLILSYLMKRIFYNFQYVPYSLCWRIKVLCSIQRYSQIFPKIFTKKLKENILTFFPPLWHYFVYSWVFVGSFKS